MHHTHADQTAHAQKNKRAINIFAGLHILGGEKPLTSFCRPKMASLASLAEHGDPSTSAARALQVPRFLAGGQKKAQKDEAKEAAKQ